MENPHNLLDWKKSNLWHNPYISKKEIIIEPINQKLEELFGNWQKFPKLSVNFMKFLLCSFVASSHA